ncbi:MAG: hypothetical protein QXR30_02750 [Candidatus Woesearchaeota archaeon]
MKKAVDFKFIVGLIIMSLILILSLIIFLNPLKQKTDQYLNTINQEKNKLDKVKVSESYCISILDYNFKSLPTTSSPNLDYVVGGTSFSVECDSELSCNYLKQKAQLFCELAELQNIIILDKRNSKNFCYDSSCKETTSCSGGLIGESDTVYFLRTITGTKDYYLITIKKGTIR